MELNRWRRLMIDVRMAPAAAAEDTALVNELAALVNSVYALAEEGLWADGTPRTTPEEDGRTDRRRADRDRLGG